jgi:hypothetical protein
MIVDEPAAEERACAVLMLYLCVFAAFLQVGDCPLHSAHSRITPRIISPQRMRKQLSLHDMTYIA